MSGGGKPMAVAHAQAPPWTFEVVRGEAAADLSAARSANPFQNPRWVQAAAAARGRAHQFVVVRAARGGSAPACLFGGLHRRAGLTVFESMPMGGYGGWVCAQGLAPADESALTSQWLGRAPWTVVRLTSEPGRAAALPEAALWPLPARLRRRLDGRDFETHLLDLTGDDAARLQRVRPNVRSYLRRVDALGYSFEINGPGALADFCAWYRRGSQGWRAAAGTLLPDAFFAALHDGGGMDIWRAVRDGNPVGAAAFLLGRVQVQYQASGAAKVAGPVSAMDALLWTAARHYRERGFETMNLGASEGLDSVRRFKEKFGAVPAGYRCVTYLMPRLAGRLGLAPGAEGRE
jgi:hypothetical protein